jgi:hypothetical protein
LSARVKKSRSRPNSDSDLRSTDTAGISLYRDCLYRNLYVMPIYDVQNRVQRVFIINVESHAKCDQNMSNMASCIGEFSILCTKNADMLLYTTNIGIAYKCCLYARL